MADLIISARERCEQRWKALQSLAVNRHLSYFPDVVVETVSLTELINLCNDLESLLHIAPGRGL